LLTDRHRSDRNVIQKEAENKLKYENLSIELQRMCNMKYCMIQVIIGVTGIVTKRLEKYLERIPEKHSVDSLRRDIAHNKENATI